MPNINISLSQKILDEIDSFCEVSGASRSGLISVLVRDYLDDLAEAVSEFSKEIEEEDEEELDEENEEEEEEE